MLFSSMFFLWVFLPIILFLYYFINSKYKNYLLLIGSLIFYAWGEPKYILIMLISIIINYICGIAIERANSKSKEKLILLLCVFANLSALTYFKYFNFILYNLNELFNGEFTSRNIALPIGISFYTFQALSYVVDVYRSKINNREMKAQKNIFNLALYISFFPQLIAGPIIKYCDIEEQLENRSTNNETVAYGIKRFVFGLGKKVLISNSMASLADKIFILTDNELSIGIAWLGIIAYTLQIYYDFSGYSDMAIGLGRVFGFQFNENFKLHIRGLNPPSLDGIRF